MSAKFAVHLQLIQNVVDHCNTNTVICNATHFGWADPGTTPQPDTVVHFDRKKHFISFNYTNILKCVRRNRHTIFEQGQANTEQHHVFDSWVGSLHDVSWGSCPRHRQYTLTNSAYGQISQVAGNARIQPAASSSFPGSRGRLIPHRIVSPARSDSGVVRRGVHLLLLQNHIRSGRSVVNRPDLRNDRQTLHVRRRGSQNRRRFVGPGT